MLIKNVESLAPKTRLDLHEKCHHEDTFLGFEEILFFLLFIYLFSNFFAILAFKIRKPCYLNGIKILQHFMNYLKFE